MSDGDGDYECEPQDPNPLFWLEFRTFDDGLSATTPDSELSPTCMIFPQFRQLPPELRIRIWECLLQPRIIVVSCLQRDHHQERRREELQRRTSPGPAVPVLLHIDRESRALALKHYELSFSWRVSKLLSDTPVSRSVSRPARVYFNFALDALLLTGELEAFDMYGFNSPMVYFLRREDTNRVRHVACAFRELGYPNQESENIFGCLWHVVDRFPAAERLLLTVAEGDEERIGECSSMLSPNNVVQKIWSGWMSGTTVTSSRMADKQMLLVRETELAKFIATETA